MKKEKNITGTKKEKDMNHLTPKQISDVRTLWAEHIERDSRTPLDVATSKDEAYYTALEEIGAWMETAPDYMKTQFTGITLDNMAEVVANDWAEFLI